MKDEFTNYLKAIGMTNILIERVESIFSFYQELCPDEITGIFVSNSVKKDGTNVFESLWFFTDSRFVMEAFKFASTDDDSFDILSTEKGVCYCKIDKRDFDFETATDESRLAVEVWYNEIEDLMVTLTASGINCTYLKDIIFRYIKPLLD